MPQSDLELATAADLEPVEQNPFTDAYSELETAIDAEETLDEINDCVKFIKDAEAERDQFIEHYKQKFGEKILLAQKLCDDRTKTIRDRIAVLTEKLRRYAETHLPDDRKSIKLPSGTIGFSKQSPLFFFDDLKPIDGSDKRLIHFVKHNAYNFLKVKYSESVDWQAFKGKLDINDGGDVYFVETGEIIDGLHAQRRPDKFTVKTK